MSLLTCTHKELFDIEIGSQKNSKSRGSKSATPTEAKIFGYQGGLIALLAVPHNGLVPLDDDFRKCLGHVRHLNGAPNVQLVSFDDHPRGVDVELGIGEGFYKKRTSWLDSGSSLDPGLGDEITLCALHGGDVVKLLVILIEQHLVLRPDMRSGADVHDALQVGVSFNETFTEHLRQVVGLQGEYKIILLSWTTPAGGDPDNWNTVMQTPRGRLPRRGQGKSEGSDS
ncbi:hypothetical protein QTO34_009175 [Cnephaeus nilssonii]|uniref:Uncharacterized protein n=1 Tax=Cnephaeus nilssonii TaxID=3371016 RepID=A0AA40HHA7_CNENI|nr:hypothetical protein QTO34_009175 [Eptesicus nilssonii]